MASSLCFLKPSSRLDQLLLTIGLLVFIAPGACQFIFTGFTVSLSDDLQYFVSPYSAGNVTVDRRHSYTLKAVHGHIPVTVVQGAYRESELPDLFKNWTEIDDVFQPTFTETVLTSDAFIRRPASSQHQVTTIPSFGPVSVPSGPYFLELETGQLYPVYRLYSDFAGAFTQSLLQKPDGSFQTLAAQIPGSADLTVGVPSRLYYTPTAAKPLAGVRIAVKNIIDLAGVKKSNGNRAWYHLYPAANRTASTIQSLIDAGAVIVGYQKASQFAHGERATADWVDYHSPFNPRGDGYQDPLSSSSGAGASIASYEWLDIAVGTDTGGSIRLPSAAQGVFGNRPTHGIARLDGVTPLAPALDTVGFITRSPVLWDIAASVMYAANYTSYTTTHSTTGPSLPYPSKIYTYRFPVNSSSPVDTLLTAFTRNLSTLLSAPVSPIDLDSAWSASHNSSSSSSSSSTTLATLLNTTYVTLVSKSSAALVHDPFFAAYAAAHQNRTPFADPAPLARWAYGDTLPTPSALADALANKTRFMAWFNAAVLPSCAAGVLVYPHSPSDASALPAPRDRYFAAPGLPLAFAPPRISVFAGVPDVAVPVGEVDVFSAVTGRVEPLPVGVDVVGPWGCDGMLIGLVRRMVDAGLLAAPKVGRSGVEGGEILF